MAPIIVEQLRVLSVCDEEESLLLLLASPTSIGYFGSCSWIYSLYSTWPLFGWCYFFLGMYRCMLERSLRYIKGIFLDASLTSLDLRRMAYWSMIYDPILIMETQGSTHRGILTNTMTLSVRVEEGNTPYFTQHLLV